MSSSSEGRRLPVVAAMRDLKTEFSHLIDALPELIWTAQPDGQIEFLNRRWREYTGSTTEELARSGIDDLLHPDDRLQATASFARGIRAGKPFDVEYRLRRLDGAYRWFQSRHSPVTDVEGRIVRWCNSATDIDDRKRSEADLQRAHLQLTVAQQVSATGSFTSDLVADEHVCSEEFYRICEFEPGSKVSIKRLRDIVHTDDVSLYDDVIARGIAGEDVNFEFRIITSRGNLKYLHVAARIGEHDAHRRTFMGAVQDVTERRAAEAALAKAGAELAHVARVGTLGALTASIAHEVNQPLSGIITNASTCLRMLAADPPNLDGARMTAQRTLRDGNRASDVIKRLRALFAHTQPVTETIDLNDAAREVLALSASELDSSRVVLQTDFAEDLPAVRGDRVQLQQVILNLVVNAADAMRTVHDGARNLLVATVREGAGAVRLSVCDCGSGIDPKNFDKIFDAFFTTKSYGMGIGLSISRSIIVGHEGRLWASANDGPGATFSFSLPCGTEVAMQPGG